MGLMPHEINDPGKNTAGMNSPGINHPRMKLPRINLLGMYVPWDECPVL